MVQRQIEIARSALRREAPRWQILEGVWEQRASVQEPVFWLVSPWCPRPEAPKVRALGDAEPEIISLSDLTEEFDNGFAGPTFKTLFRIARGYDGR